MWKVIYIGIFLFSFLLSFFLTEIFKKIAVFLKVLDYPSSRKVHKNPTPLLGGLAIFLSFALIILLGILLIRINIVPEFIKEYIPGVKKVSGKLLAILAGGFLVVAFGLIDDIIGLKPLQKLALQILSALIVFSVGIKISLFVPNIFFSLICTLVWLILMMNSFNLLDNMDGLSSGVAFICGSILFISAFRMEQLFVATILAVFLGSVAGFLKHNFPPAKVFMGECGSSFLGYFLGASAILMTFYRYEASKSFLPLFTPLIVFSVPLFDTLSVIWIRKKRKLPVFKADKNHFSHRLVSFGMTKREAILLIYFLTLCTGMGALQLSNMNLFGGVLVLLQTAIIIGMVGILEHTGRKRNGTWKKEHGLK